jgi:hypothetical protein
VLGNKEWTTNIFMSYANKRQELMRRLRIVGQQSAIVRAEFTEAARIRRKLAFDCMVTSPDIGIALSAIMKGPFRGPKRVRASRVGSAPHVARSRREVLAGSAPISIRRLSHSIITQFLT